MSHYGSQERLLYKHKAGFSPKRAAELTHNMYEIEYILPNAKHKQKIILKRDKEQEILYKVIHTYKKLWWLGCPITEVKKNTASQKTLDNLKGGFDFYINNYCLIWTLCAGDCLLSPIKSIIGTTALNFRVRNEIGCDHGVKSPTHSAQT